MKSIILTAISKKAEKKLRKYFSKPTKTGQTEVTVDVVSENPYTVRHTFFNKDILTGERIVHTKKGDHAILVNADTYRNVLSKAFWLTENKHYTIVEEENGTDSKNTI